MSRVEVYVFQANGDAEHFKDARNAFGFGSHVWRILAPKYGVKFDFFSSDEELKGLWNIAFRWDVSRRDRIVMSATFDRTWVKKENFPELISAIQSFHQEHPSETLKQFSEILIEAQKMDILGIGINANSVSCDYWGPVQNEEAPESDDPDNHPDSYHTFNLNRDLTDQVELFGVFA